jgi:hypothetical protein
VFGQDLFITHLALTLPEEAMTLYESYSRCRSRGNIGNSKEPIKFRVDPKQGGNHSPGIADK